MYRWDRKKLLRYWVAYGVNEKFSMIEIVYSDNAAKYEIGNLVRGWCKSESGERQR